MSTAPQLRVSVVIPTFRDPEVLSAALWSVGQQTLAPEQYEVLVVDNAADTATEALTRRHADAARVRVRYCQEHRLGLCHARNAGVRNARAPIIAFLDDDAEAEPTWLEALLNTFGRHPDAWGVGGKILPNWERPAPSWFDDSMLRSLSILDLGPDERILRWPERVIGANMAFRKRAFEQVGRFDPLLDRRGSLLLGHGDTEIQERIHEAGASIYYAPSAVVHHRVPAERLTKSYFYRRFYGAGRSKAILVSRKGGRKLVREVRRHLRVMRKQSLQLLAHARSEKERFLAVRQLAHCGGFIRQAVAILPRLFHDAAGRREHRSAEPAA